MLVCWHICALNLVLQKATLPFRVEQPLPSSQDGAEQALYNLEWAQVHSAV